jgi:hypothetical protein
MLPNLPVRMQRHPAIDSAKLFHTDPDQRIPDSCAQSPKRAPPLHRGLPFSLSLCASLSNLQTAPVKIAVSQISLPYNSFAEKVTEVKREIDVG